MLENCKGLLLKGAFTKVGWPAFVMLSYLIYLILQVHINNEQSEFSWLKAQCIGCWLADGPLLFFNGLQHQIRVNFPVIITEEGPPASAFISSQYLGQSVYGSHITIRAAMGCVGHYRYRWGQVIVQIKPVTLFLVGGILLEPYPPCLENALYKGFTV